MAKLIWSERAIADLENIYDYISADSLFYAQYTILDILKISERLELFPASGRRLPEFPAMPHKEVILNNYRVIYRYDAIENIVNIVTVLHSRQLLKKDYFKE